MSVRNKVLITGAGGLLGKKLVTELKIKNYEIHALVRPSSEAADKDVIYHNVDFNSEWTTDSLPSDVKAIFHLAQSDDFRDFPAKANNIFDVNILSTARLLDFAYQTKVESFIYASSGGVYGTGSNAFAENASINSNDKLGYYLASKLCSEILVQNYSQFMNVSVLRFFFMYGKEQKRSMLIPRLVDNIRKGEKIVLQGEDGLSINPIHVVDAAKAVAAVLNLKGSHTFNIGGPDVLTLGQISRIIAEKLNKDLKTEFNTSEAKNIIGNIDAMKNLLSTPQIHFRDGVDDLL